MNVETDLNKSTYKIAFKITRYDFKTTEYYARTTEHNVKTEHNSESIKICYLNVGKQSRRFVVVFLLI